MAWNGLELWLDAARALIEARGALAERLGQLQPTGETLTVTAGQPRRCLLSWRLMT